MSTNPKKAAGSFDVKTVEALAALMTEHDLSEINLRDGSQHLRLRRGTAPTVAVAQAVPMPASPTPASARPAPDSPAPVAAAAASKKNLVEIKSETVGTFYAQAKPTDPPLVKVGDRVTPSKVIGLVEVMKTYNEVQAGCSGIIVEILVTNGKYVEFNEVLVRVDPS